jgi:hypothetical protein
MKTVLNYLIIVIATALFQLIMPWWVIAVVPFVVYLVRPEPPLIAFVVSLLAVATVWASYAIFLDSATQGSISYRIAELFSLPNATALLVAISLLSGLVAGFGGSAGSLVRQVFVKEAT